MLTIDLSQVNTWFGIALPAIVAFIAGLIRQDNFAPWLNELISYVVIVALAITQTILGGQLGGSSLSNFVIVTALAVAGIQTKYGQQFQVAVQRMTSIKKAPPAPAPLSAEQIASIVVARLSAAGIVPAQPLSIDAQPTAQMQAVRISTPPPPGYATVQP